MIFNKTCQIAGEGWNAQIRYIETMEYHLAINGKEIRSHATLMNLKDIILSEICQLKAANTE